MLYFLIKCTLSGIIVGIVSQVARRAPTLGALIVFSACLRPSDLMALARHRRYRSDRKSRTVNILVCSSFLTDVLTTSCHASIWHRVLAEFSGRMHTDDSALRFDCLGAREIWHQSLEESS